MRLASSSTWIPALLALLALSSPAEAKRTGMNLACHNCHEGTRGPKLSVMLSSPRVEPGQTLTITVTATHPDAKVGGVLVDSKGVGEMKITDALGTHLFAPPTEPSMPPPPPIKTQATHALPQPYVNGQVQFSFGWLAPATVGPAEFEIWSNAGNDNRVPDDDSASELIAAVGVGCNGAWYYVDGDKDGAGDEKTRVFSCDAQAQAGRILQGGDCDDANAQVKPGAAELCNSRDDNCDGKADEGFTPLLLVTDADGDGHGARSGMTMIGCPPVPGFALTFDDCDDHDAAINPAAQETANGRDDNCNGKVDDLLAMGVAGAPMTMPTTTPTAMTPTTTAPKADSGCSSAPASPGSGLGLAWGVGLVLALRRRASSAREFSRRLGSGG